MSWMVAQGTFLNRAHIVAAEAPTNGARARIRVRGAALRGARIGDIFLFLLPFPSPFGRLRRAFLFWEGLFVFWERKGRVGEVR
jgi:hypothetical protein